MKIIKKIVKWLLILLVLIFIGGFVAVKLMSEDRPAVVQGADADAVAKDMLAALNGPAWDTLHYLRWEFVRNHKYLWDKKENNAVIEWEGNKVVLDLDQVDGIAFVDDVKVEGDAAANLIQQAWAHWCNDSFWMFAPFKVFDPGTTRTVVETGSDQTGLMITYESGGVTPGDSYLWLLGDDNVPTGYKMWTFIPIKGMHMTWDGWTALDGGSKIATVHESKLLSFEMKNVAEGSSPSELGYPNNIFEGI